MSIRVEEFKNLSSEQKLRFLISEALTGNKSLALSYYSMFVPKSSDYKAQRNLYVMTDRVSGSWNLEIAPKQWVVYDGLNKRYMDPEQYISWIDKRTSDNLHKLSRYMRVFKSIYDVDFMDAMKK